MAGEGGGDDDKSIDVDAAEMDEMVEGKFDCFNIEWCISFYWYLNHFLPVRTG